MAVPRNHGGLRIGLLVAIALTASMVFPGMASGQYSSGPDFEPLTDTDGEVVFDWSTQACDSIHYADLATRAFRDHNGRVQLILAHTSGDVPPFIGGSRRMYNTLGNLGALTNDCNPLMKGDHVYDPASNNNDEWLAAPYTLDGQTVHSLMYDEYQPWDDTTPPEPGPDYCRDDVAASSSGCHYSTYTRGKSTNKGDNYNALAPNPFVAGIPFKYTPSPTGPPPGGQSQGYADGSNIAKGPDGLYYAMFLARQTPRGDPANAIQKFGTCVMRTDDLDDETSWIAWGDGPDADTTNEWEVQFIKPYPSQPPNPEHHVCAPVNQITPGGTISMSESLTYNRFLGKYMVIGSSTNNTPGSGHDPIVQPPEPADWDLYYSLSKDMVNWERKRLLMHVPHKFNPCTQEPGNATLYSSAIDHNSTTRNFETTGRKFHVYFTRFSNCSGSGNDRDLVRVPVELKAETAKERVATLEDGSLDDPDTGFDDSGSAGGGFDLRSDGISAYEGNYYAQATYFNGLHSPWGALNVDWERGDDVWYGAAFWIPTNFNDPAANNADSSIMHWASANDNGYSGVFLRSDGQWELRRATVTISQPFTLPEDQWFYLEVRQRLGQGAAAGPLNAVYVNGAMKVDSATDNMFTQASLVPTRVKFGLPKITGEFGLVYVDRAYVSRRQLGPVGAPPTPEIFTGQEGNTYNWLHWQASPGATGYRLYRLGNTGKLIELETTPIVSPQYLHWNQPNCTKYRYVVSAVGALGRQSPQSEPLELMPRDPAAQPCP